jgi:hypothetical protein
VDALTTYVREPIVTGGASLLPRALARAIDDAIDASRPAWETIVGTNRESIDPMAPSLVVKYVPTKYAGSYRGPNAGLFIGSRNFTWGRGVYVVGIEEPLSTAIYGRVGDHRSL